MQREWARDFFISYMHEDANWAKWIAWQLEEAGYRVTLAAWDFPAGGNVAIEIDSALQQAERIIAVLSPHYLDSAYASSEWAIAYQRDPKGLHGLLLPVRVYPCEVEGLLGSRIYIDLVGQDEEAARKRLLYEVQRGRRKPKSAPPFPQVSDVPTEPPPFPGVWQSTTGDVVLFQQKDVYGRSPQIASVRETEQNANVQQGNAAILLPPHIPDEPYYFLPSREQNVRSLLSALEDPQGFPVLVIDGLGGMGKTALAVELARRACHQQLFEKVVGESAKQEDFVGNGIVQVNESVLGFEQLLDAIAQQLDHWEIPTLALKEKQAKLAQLLRQHRYLILIDNLESADNAHGLVAKLRGFLSSCRAIVTSRQKIYHDFVLALSLRQLDMDDAFFFIRKDLQQRGGDQFLHIPQEKMTEIWEITGGAPLALKLVVAQSMFLDLDIVLKQLRQARGDIYPFIFRQSWELLSFAAQLILIYIGRTVVTTVSWNELAGLKEISEDEEELLAAVRQLIDYSLLDVYVLPGQKRYGIHQLTRQFVQSELPKMWEVQEEREK